VLQIVLVEEQDWNLEEQNRAFIQRTKLTVLIKEEELKMNRKTHRFIYS
jgi:hypothetical protein